MEMTDGRVSVRFIQHVEGAVGEFNLIIMKEHHPMNWIRTVNFDPR
jgi:hypothetical protein